MTTTFHLINGFLGSGKTTLLDRLLRELSQQHRIAVIQNEFAPTGVDGQTLKRSNEGFHLVEIVNGSVFCVCQMGSFLQTLEKLLDEVRPEMVFLEASGLADPLSIIDLMSAPNLGKRIELGQIISLVDAPNFFRGLSTLERFKHQLMVADTIIINKMDLFEGNLDDITDRLRELNPYAHIQTATYVDIDWQALASANQVEHRAARRYEGSVPAGRPPMNSCVLRTHDRVDREGLQRFLHSLGPDCPRAKGVLGLTNGQFVSVHSVYDELEIREIEDYVGPTQLIVFGGNLTPGEVRRKFKACTHPEQQKLVS